MKQLLTDILALPSLKAEWKGPSEPDARPVIGWCTDSRRIKPDQIFVALVGDHYDGHTFVSSAFDKGARAAVVSNQWYESVTEKLNNSPLIVVPDTLVAYQEIARHWRNQFKGTVVGLTGSSGKTTAKEMIYSVLSRRFHVLRNIKSFNNHVGVPATLLQLNEKHQVAVIEMGTSNFGEIERLGFLAQPDICVLLNIGFAHLEHLQSLEGVCRAKLEICRHADPEGTVIYNADDPHLRDQNYELKMKAPFGLKAGSGYTARHLQCNAKGCYSFDFMNERINLPIPGRHNVYNALAAAVVGVRFCLSVSDIKAGLEAMPQLSNRMQVMWTKRGIIMNDVYNSNPSSCYAAMLTAADIEIPEDGRRIAVLGDMLELGKYSVPEHEKLAARAEKTGFDMLLLYGEQTTHTEKAGIKTGLSVQHFDDKDKLIEYVLEIVRPADLVLVKGSRSMHMEHVIEALNH